MSSKVWLNNISMLIFYYVGIGVMEENVFICREYTLKYSVKSGHYIGNFPLSGPGKKKKPNLLLFSKFMIVSKKNCFKPSVCRAYFEIWCKNQVLEDTRPIYKEFTTEQRS